MVRLRQYHVRDQGTAYCTTYYIQQILLSERKQQMTKKLPRSLGVICKKGKSLQYYQFIPASRKTITIVFLL